MQITAKDANPGRFLAQMSLAFLEWHPLISSQSPSRDVKSVSGQSPS
jgi:hypothetical protein